MAYKPGRNHAVCDLCGFKHYADELKKTWDGYLHCKDCYEDKHPALEAHPLSADRILAKVVSLPKEYFIEPPEI